MLACEWPSPLLVIQDFLEHADAGPLRDALYSGSSKLVDAAFVYQLVSKLHAFRPPVADKGGRKSVMGYSKPCRGRLWSKHSFLSLCVYVWVWVNVCLCVWCVGGGGVHAHVCVCSSGTVSDLLVLCTLHSISS